MRSSRRELRELFELLDAIRDAKDLWWFHHRPKPKPKPKGPTKAQLKAKAEAELAKAKQGLSEAKNASKGACEEVKMSRQEMEEAVKKANAIKAFEAAVAKEEASTKKIAELEEKIKKNDF